MEKNKDETLSKTQWQYLRQQALLAKTPGDIDHLLKELEEHTGRKAGAVWTEPLTEIKKALKNLSQPENGTYENQILFLDALVRYQLHHLKTARKNDR